jgi:signal transduction histidine kinase
MENSPTKDLTLITETNGPQVRITIKDTGCGIPEKIIDALFQPFFSTKKGKHPGLGLFVAKALFQPYAASFSVSSREGETIFSVYLPTSVARGN